MCHIVPFATTAGEEVQGRWEEGLRAVAGIHIVQTQTAKNGVELTNRFEDLFSSAMGASDHSWNTIPLSPDLHEWWGRAYFGFKYLGTSTADSGDPDQIMTLRIQFHWMVWRERGIGKKPEISLGRTEESITAAFRPYLGNTSGLEGKPVVAITRPATGFNVESGDIFQVFVLKRHMQKMILAFDLQWALVKLLAMGGGVEAIKEVPDDPEFLDNYWMFSGPKSDLLDLQAYADALEANAKQDTGEGPGRRGTD